MGAIAIEFGIYNPPWGTVSTPREAFEGVQANAQWAEDHDFVWFSVIDHLIQIGGARSRFRPVPHIAVPLAWRP